MTRFSVVIPLHDKAPFIEATLASVQRQSLPAVEVIVIDDGSTDGGADLVATAFPEVRLIRQARQGPGSARTTGVRLATGDWVAFLDADDVWAACHLAELAHVVSSVPQAGMVGTSYRHARGVEVEASLGRLCRRRSGRPKEIDYFARRDSRRVIWTSSIAVRRAALLDAGPFVDAPAGQDLEMWCRIALHHPVAISRRRTAVYRLGTGGITESRQASTPVPQPSIDRADLPELPSGLRTGSPSRQTVAAALADGRHRVSRRSLQLYLDRYIASWRSAALRFPEMRLREVVRHLHRASDPSHLGPLLIFAAPRWSRRMLRSLARWRREQRAALHVRSEVGERAPDSAHPGGRE